MVVNIFVFCLLSFLFSVIKINTLTNNLKYKTLVNTQNVTKNRFYQNIYLNKNKKHFSKHINIHTLYFEPYC